MRISKVILERLDDYLTLNNEPKSDYQWIVVFVKENTRTRGIKANGKITEQKWEQLMLKLQRQNLDLCAYLDARIYRQ